MELQINHDKLFELARLSSDKLRRMVNTRKDQGRLITNSSLH